MISLHRISVRPPSPELAGVVTNMALEAGSWFLGRRYGRQQELEYDLAYWKDKVDRAVQERDEARQALEEVREEVSEAQQRIAQVVEAYQNLEQRFERRRHAWKRLSWWRRLLAR